MNAVILGQWVIDDEIKFLYIYVHSVGSTCRMGLIRRALDSVRSQLFNALSLDIFGPFFTSPDSFEVGKSVKYRRNFDLNLSFIHVTF